MEEGEKNLWRALTFVEDMHSLYSRVAPVLSDIFRTPKHETRATIYKYNPANETLDAVVATGVGGEEVTKIETKVGQGLAGNSFYEKEPVNIENAGNHPMHRDVSKKTGFKVGPAMLVPLYDRAKTNGIGLIYVMREEGAPSFTKEDMDHLITLSYPVRHVIFQDLETNVERLARIGKWVAETGHDVKNILTGFEGSVTLLGDAIKEKNWELVTYSHEIIEQAQKKISMYILDMLDFSRDRYPDYQPCDLTMLLEEVVKIVSDRAVKSHVSLEYEKGSEIIVPVDKDRIFRVYMNIVLNSIKALEHVEGEKRLRMDTDSESRTYTATTFLDNGPGIPKEKVPKLFLEYSGVLVGGSTQSNRIGLPVAYKIVKEHGGDIKIISEFGKGTSFIVLLPKERRRALVQ